MHSRRVKVRETPSRRSRSALSGWSYAQGTTNIGRPVFTTPDVPRERIAALRKAFDAMIRDPAVIEQAKKENFDIDPTSGEAMQALVSEIVGMPKLQSDRLRDILE